MNGGYLPGANIPSETLRPSPDAKVAAWLEGHAKDSQFLERRDSWRASPGHYASCAGKRDGLNWGISSGW